MGERGHTLHVLDGKIADGLAKVGHRVAVLGRNERWTTFVPFDVSAFEDGRASEILDCPLLHVWFDDDLGVSVTVYASGNLVGELSLPGDDADVTETDLEFIKSLEDLDVLTRSMRADLLKRMSEAGGLREWVAGHGLERLLHLPCHEPLPTDVTEKTLRALLPESAVILDPPKVGRPKAKARKPKDTVAGKASAPTKESWSEPERATLEFHCEYWRTVFSMNNWKLYNRYKKHLPADQRRDVDELCDAVALGNDDELDARVKGILSRI